MRAFAITAALALAGCNQLLGNGNFAAPSADACTGASCPPDAPGQPDAPLPDASLVCQQMGKQPTEISGVVYAPNGTTPLSNAVVYIPKTAPDPMPTGQLCCAPATGGAVISQITAADGSFHLMDVPAGVPNPIVIQVGKWRRQITAPAVDECAQLALPSAQTSLPADASQGDMPMTAIVTGEADSLECIVRQLGIADSEIGTMGSPGHVHLYVESEAPAGAVVNAFASGFPGGTGAFAPDTQLLTSTQLPKYDQVLLSCPGDELNQPAAETSWLVPFANLGGRLFLEHYYNADIAMNAPWQGVAQFDLSATSNDPPNPVTVSVDQTFPAGQRLTSWLTATGVSTDGTFSEQNARNTVQSINPAQATAWLHLPMPAAAGLSTDELFTFDTPVGGTACGRVTFSDLHAVGTNSGAVVFPNECATSPLDPQQDVIAFLFFDTPTCGP